MASASTSKDSISELGTWLNDSIYAAHKPKRAPKSEVIFFHDIDLSKNGKPYLETWMSNSEPAVYWPKEWLSIEFPESRISSAYYQGAIWKTRTAGHMDIYLIAENLRQDIVNIYETDCPIFLVGHGLGGLVIKELVYAMEVKLSLWKRGVFSGFVSPERTDFQRLSSFVENIQGVFFYNTPFLGSKLADYTAWLPKEESPLLKIVKTLSEDASRRNEWFREWRKYSGCTNEAIFAACQTKVDVWYGYWHTYVAVEASVRYDIDCFFTAATSDHFDACKPCNQRDNRFKNLVLFLQRPRESRKIEPAPKLEDNAEIESTKLLIKTVKSVQTIRQGVGLYLKVDELEKIRKFSGTSSLLMDCLSNAGMEKINGTAQWELWR